jgi:predicted LPLAT superfamily acyltransferase
MNYSYTQLTRVAPDSYKRHVWRARASRLWKRYVRAMAALAALIGNTILTVIYFIVLPAFAWLAKRGERREAQGWSAITGVRNESPTSQY